MTDIQIGNAPCSWGTLEFEGLEGERITCERMLDELVETGYAGTELGDWGFMPTDPASLSRELKSREVTMVGAFVPVALKDPAAHAAGKEEALKVSRLLAAVAETDCRPFLVLADDNGSDPIRTRNAGRVLPEMGISEKEWENFAKGTEDVARAVLEETGLVTVFHHHCGGYVETPEEIAELLKRTDPSLVSLVFDTGHYAYGTGKNDADSVLRGLDRFSDRIRHMHFKDCEPDVASRARNEGWDYFDAVKHGVFCELGKGFVDFPGVTTWLRDRKYKGWIVVEQDVLPGMGVPKDSARRNREYLRGIDL